MLNVQKPGSLSTIQDRGRFGHQQFGIIRSGVMDQVAYRIGNALLHQHDKAAIEMTMLGGTYAFLTPTHFVVAALGIHATLNGTAIHANTVYRAKAGDILKCQKIRGVRAYLCVEGGFTVDDVLGSRSTYMKAQIGGLSGRPLEKNDIVPFEASKKSYPKRTLSLRHFYKEAPIRFIEGTEWDKLGEAIQQSFIEKTFRISLQADRMGYRLASDTPIDVAEPFSLISEAVTFGTIQLPASGEPIILMADCQTTGGYPKIGQVISADLHRLAQMPPGTAIQFEKVSLEEATKATIALEKTLRHYEKQLRSSR